MNLPKKKKSTCINNIFNSPILIIKFLEHLKEYSELIHNKVLLPSMYLFVVIFENNHEHI